MITRRQAVKLASTAGAALLSGCAQPSDRQATLNDAAQGNTAQTKRLRVLAASDTHGMFVPWDFALDEEDRSGSMARLATAVKELRDENTLLVDAGDTIQDNMADLFRLEEVHPMIACMNAIGYDIGVTGNHEYNFGMDVVRNTVASFEGKVAALSNMNADVEPGPIRRCDVSRIYKHQNTLYSLEMTGAQLKEYLEWSACFYKTFRKGDLSPSFEPEVPL